MGSSVVLPLLLLFQCLKQIAPIRHNNHHAGHVDAVFGPQVLMDQSGLLNTHRDL